MYAVSGWLARLAREALFGRTVETAPMPAATALFTPVEPDAHQKDRMLFVGRLNARRGSTICCRRWRAPGGRGRSTWW